MSVVEATWLIDRDQASMRATTAHIARAPQVTRSPAMTTRELTKRMASGNAEALAVFYEQWFATMYHEAQRATGRDESFCLDVVQDVMLRVIKKIGSKENDAQLAAWLRRVVRSCAYDRLRSEIARARREDIRGKVRSGESAVDDATRAVHDEQQLDWLRREIDALDEGLRRPLLLRVLSGWTLAQIGALLGLSPGAVDGRVHRAMKTLRQKAEQSDE